MEESLTKTIHDLQFAVENLQAALGQGTNVEGSVILLLLGRTRELKTDVKRLLSDHLMDQKATT